MVYRMFKNSIITRLICEFSALVSLKGGDLRYEYGL